MKKGGKILVVFLIVFFALLGSCRKDFNFEISSGDLRFSKDTVFLDTVFANISSSTYSLKVYNDSNDDISIPEIRLKSGESTYRLNVDGLAGNVFNNIPILAQDSLFVFVETVIPQTDLQEVQFLNTDAIQFIGSEETQEVQLVSLVKDAIFLYPKEDANGMSETLLLGFDEEGNELRVEGFVLDDDELIFSNEKPYVIYGFAAVPENRVLNINAGARVHFHENSGIIVDNNASLQVLGELSEDEDLLENEVIFEGDRLEPEFENVPGQWGTIWFYPESKNNQLNYLTIKNATIGLLCEGMENDTSLNYDLRNVQITNSSAVNLWARTANLEAQNSIFGGAGQLSVYCNLGGNYDFKHCTIANYWINSFRSTPALLIDNFIEIEPDVFLKADLTKASFGNCIIDGNRFIELNLLKSDDAQFNFSFENSLIRFVDSSSSFEGNPLYDFSNTEFYNEIGLNEELDFLEPLQNNFELQENSAAIGFGSLNISLSVPFDIKGNSRQARSDSGAYNFVVE